MHVPMHLWHFEGVSLSRGQMVVMGVQLCECAINHRIVHIKGVNCTVCDLAVTNQRVPTSASYSRGCWEDYTA